MKTGLILTAAIIIALVGYWYLSSDRTGQQRPATVSSTDTINDYSMEAGSIESPTMDPGNTNDNNTGSDSTMTDEDVKVFNLDASNFKYDVTRIDVKKGAKVKIVLSNSEGFHDWVLDEFNAKTEQIQAGQTTSVEFNADKSGTFEYYCSVGNHRQLGMVGTLIVE